MGYAGGKAAAPTYRSLGGHAETIQIDFNPAVISYETLLNLFWEGHYPEDQPWSDQYRNILFYHSEAQRRLAEQSRKTLAVARGGIVRTEIRPFEGFHPAEEYHQKHALQQYRVFLDDLKRTYPEDGDWIHSTTAARLNGYLGGYGDCDNLSIERDTLELSAANKAELTRMVCGIPPRRTSP